MGNDRLPLGCCADHVKAFERLGWAVAKSRGKNHVVLKKDGARYHLSIPNHQGKDVKRGLIGKQLANAGITEDEYIEAFGKQKKPSGQ